MQGIAERYIEVEPRTLVYCVNSVTGVIVEMLVVLRWLCHPAETVVY
jgi:hypothetical protein